MMFRQRAGRVNWKRLTSLDYDRLLQDPDGETVGELNSCLDNLTFSLFSVKDVEGNSCEAVVLFARVMQLLVEYLLCSQEAQAKVLVETAARAKQLRRRNHGLIREMESMREDVKVYKRQLALLKSRGLDLDQSKRYRVVSGAEGSSKSEVALLHSFLTHEESTRTFMKEMLEEQRRVLAKELAVVTPGDREGSEQSRQLKEQERRLQDQTAELMHQQALVRARELRLEQLRAEIELEKERGSGVLRDKEREAESARQRAEISLMARTEALNSLEADLRRRESALTVREQVSQGDRSSLHSSTGSFPERLLLSQLELKSKLYATRSIFGLLQRGIYVLVIYTTITRAGLKVMTRMAFSSWLQFTRSIEATGNSAAIESLRLELERLRGRELDLSSRLREEQKRVVLEQAKYGYFARRNEPAAP